MPYRQLVGVGPDGRMVINDTDPDLLAAHEALTISAHGIGGEWFSTYLDRGITRSGITAGQAGYFFEEFTDIARWQRVMGANSMSAVTTLVGGVAQVNIPIFVADMVQYVPGDVAFGSPTICLGGSPFYIAHHSRRAIGPGSNSIISIGLEDVAGTGHVLQGYLRPHSQNFWSAEIMSIAGNDIIISPTGVDANWHNFEFWYDGVTYYFSVDGETPGTPPTAFSVLNTYLRPNLYVVNDGGTQMTAQFDKALWVFPRAA